MASSALTRPAPQMCAACQQCVVARHRRASEDIERLHVRKLPSSASPGEPLAPSALTNALVAAQRPLYAFVRGLVGDPEQARDIMQDVFHDAWRSFKQGMAPFDADHDDVEVRRWLFHAAYCDVANAHRHRRLIRWESLETSIGSQDTRAATTGAPFEDEVADNELMRAALATLSSEDAACLLLNVIQGFSAVEIAQIIGVSPDASKKRLSRAKQRLRAAYTAQTNEPPGAPSTQEPHP